MTAVQTIFLLKSKKQKLQASIFLHTQISGTDSTHTIYILRKEHLPPRPLHTFQPNDSGHAADKGDHAQELPYRHPN